MTLDLVSKENPFLLVVLGDANAKLSQWHDKDSSTSEGISVESITSQFGLHQTINESTHILENSSSCIDLILLRNLIYQSNQELSPHSTLTVIIRLFTPNLILKSFTHHLTPAGFGIKGLSINEFDWDRAFANKHVDEKASIFNKIVLNILSDFIPHEVIVCDDKDPPWFNGKIKSLINEKPGTYNAYRSQLRKKLSSLQQG